MTGIAPRSLPSRLRTATVADDFSRSPATSNAVREAAYARIDRVMAFLDNLIGERGHVYRGKRSVADAYAYVMARWSVKTPKPYSAYPHLAAFMTRMGEDEAVKHVLAASNA